MGLLGCGGLEGEAELVERGMVKLCGREGASGSTDRRDVTGMIGDVLGSRALGMSG